MRNRTEYEGILDVDDRLFNLIGAGRKVAEKVRRLPPIPDVRVALKLSLRRERE